MNLQVDPEDYRCPCCMNYMYINFACSNKHNVCENCYMKLHKCLKTFTFPVDASKKHLPICRDETITESTSNNNIIKKECKNKDKGCNLNLYHFDDEHELECLYNLFHCKFCNSDLDETNNIRDHYESNCVNIFKYIDFENDVNRFRNIIDNETQGRRYCLTGINSIPSLINCEDQYYILMIPKSTKIDFYVFSTNKKYELSNYKIKIYTNQEDPIFEGAIYYNKLYCNSILLTDMNTDNKSLTFIIQNLFIINTKVTEKKIGNTHYFESSVVEGEPGSAGNWSYKDLEEVTNMFMNRNSK